MATEPVKRCENCGAGDTNRPAIFKGERFCSVNCAKALGIIK